jgi:hypothetical protein
MEYNPTKSTLLIPTSDNRKNYFKTQIFNDLQKKEAIGNKGEKAKLIKDLEDILLCCICYQYLDNPVSDPMCCPHYACKACYDKYFKNKPTMPCPICRRLIRKRNLVKLPIVESIKEILKDVKNSKMNDDNKVINKNCKIHSQNEIFFICLDCQVTMCPVCREENKTHEEHHLANYKRYVQLFNSIQDNFAGIKQNIAQREKNIKEYKKLIILSEEQKNSYLQSLIDISTKIQAYYKENATKLNKIIAENMEIIAKLRNFMLNIKTEISSQFKTSYDDIENEKYLENQVKQRVDKLKLNQPNKDEFETVKKNSLQNLSISLPRKISISFNKKEFLDNSHVKCIADKEGLCTFGLELSEDKNMVNAYLDIKNCVNNKINNSSYNVFIEFGKKGKILYLDQSEPANQDVYSYEKNFSIEELTETKDMNVEIILNISSITLK